MAVLQPEDGVLDLFRAVDGLHKAYWRLGGDSGMGWDLAVTHGIPCEYRNSWDLDGFLDVHSLLTTFFAIDS